MPDPDRAPSIAPANLLGALRDEAAQRTGIVRDLLLAAAEELEQLRAKKRPVSTFTVRIEADCSHALAELERLKAVIAEAAVMARGEGLRRFAAAVAEEDR